jgi:hypothetical protein
VCLSSPMERTGHDFKFKCPNCHLRMSRHNFSGGCRLIYGEYQNYILCSPQRWICYSCAKDCKTQKKARVPRKERLQHTWRDADSQLLQQLSLDHPDVAEEFPCCLSKGAGIDKKRASERNRPGFPQVRHHDGMKVDTVNELHEAMFGHSKHRGWMHFNEIFALLDAAGLSISPCGVMPLEQDLIKIDGEEIRPVMGMTRSLQHLAERQHAEAPCTPVRGFAEVDLFKDLIGQALERRQSVGNNHTFEDMAHRWNEDHAKGSNRELAKPQ